MRVSIVMPVYNVEKYVATAIQSVLNQTYKTFELIIVIDGSQDDSLNICMNFRDPRIKIVTQENRGLAGARNTGIRESSGEYIALLDSDDVWSPTKLERHVSHLDNNPEVGVSFCPSELIDEAGQPTGMFQTPKLVDIDFSDIICRNPVGNGSAPVIRRAVFDAVSFMQFRDGVKERSYFDETFRQSEDIECWMRIAASTDYKFEGLDENLTYYRVNASGLSANLTNQLDSWHRAVSKVSLISPLMVGRSFLRAQAYQFRYLARRAISSGNKESAALLLISALRCHKRILIEEPKKTLITLAATTLLWITPNKVFATLLNVARFLLIKSREKARLNNHVIEGK